ncbi:MAG: hypothetical protein LBS41_03810 [Streptococcaceae bacterium]|jgi:hypothetical protein|nr:hypothetical protein [Streptococcaceae bacterium]
MTNENNLQNQEIPDIQEFNFDEMEAELSKQFEESVSELDLLEEDREKIENPDSLGKTVFDEVVKQIGNQVGLEVMRLIENGGI